MPQTLESPQLFPSVVCDGRRARGSNWRLARTLARSGQLGVVSLAAVDERLVQQLQQGDIGGTIRWALERCPLSEIAREIIDRYFVPCGSDSPLPLATLPPLSDAEQSALQMVSAFTEVFLAKQGHRGAIGVAWPDEDTLDELGLLYGAMLAGVDCVLAPRNAAPCVSLAIELIASDAPSPDAPWTLPSVVVIDSSSAEAVTLSRSLPLQPPSRVAALSSLTNLTCFL